MATEPVENWEDVSESEVEDKLAIMRVSCPRTDASAVDFCQGGRYVNTMY